MNGINGLPGFEGLLRDHKRLATKLTSDELRAIRDYIDERVTLEQAELTFRLETLRNEFDITVRRSSETITDLYQELGDKKEIIKHYKDSDNTVLVVSKQKEARWERKQELLIAEIAKLEGESARVKTQLKRAEDDNSVKSKRLDELEAELTIANEAVKVVDEAKEAIKDREVKVHELMRVKLDNDKKDKLISNYEKEINMLKSEQSRFHREHKYAEMKVSTMHDELKKQVAEVAVKCKELTKLQFQLEMETRQEESLQQELKQAMENVQHYKKLFEDGRPPLSPRDPTVIVLKKDLDIMDMRIKSLDIGVRLRIDELKRIEERLDDLFAEERLAKQIKNEVYLQGDSYLELTAVELVKRLDSKKKRLDDELKYAKESDHPKREADMLRTEVSALMKQASICKIPELTNRAAKQLQKIDLIMRGSGNTIMPKIFKVSERPQYEHSRHNDHGRTRSKQKQHQQSTFLTASTPVNGFDSSFRTPSLRSRKKIVVSKGRSSRHPPALENHTDDSKLQYIDTVELDLSRVTPSISHRQPALQSDRMTIKSVSTTTKQAIAE